MSGDIAKRLRAEVVTCPGKGLDGNGMQHCAECCFGTGVVATTAAELRIMVLARDAADAIEARDAEIERLRAENADLQEGQLTNRWPLHKMLAAERALADRLAVALAAQGSASFDEDANLNIKRLALDAFKEARRER